MGNEFGTIIFRNQSAGNQLNYGDFADNAIFNQSPNCNRCGGSSCGRCGGSCGSCGQCSRCGGGGGGKPLPDPGSEDGLD